MKGLHLAAGLFALGLGSFSMAPVKAATLDFSGNICNNGNACSNGNLIDQSYGSITGVDITYDGSPNATGDQQFLYWASDYSDLTDIAYFNDGAQITFEAAQNYEVSIASLDLGAWPRVNRSLGFSIADLGTSNILFNTGLVTVSGAIRSSFSPGVTSKSGLVVSFFGDFFNGGVDNIVYDAKLSSPATVPLPASVLLLGAALACGFGLRRRKQA
ncbi:hypothetical protein JANAI62_36310 [Jannaschia pagri]|uniref:Ice-binding protein C-terminal domain-containing protein n=1 Tax=Jannaschia pagri TaxID=2829797 RepID=A0ABQ4NRK9_9RHOB|nr:MULTISPECIES: PEP-CTERM sorting domain-containing protein [unclassified Jannaschia]GIT93225.1 hypothetical protein JANAI61_36830 [Jannaschia sp. AI_61]GIT97008.1 hypothetical protein JANAI62_36310 [Jannaschia sp. AI_62]